MSGIYQTALPTCEPVSLATAKNWCKIFTTSDDAIVAALITAARQYVEDCTGLMLAPRTYVQSLDCFPFYPYSREPYGQLYGIGSLALYFGYGPILPTPIPPYGQNFNGHLPFEIVLLGNPVTAVDHIEYINTAGDPTMMLPGRDFIVDMTSFPARVLPLPGSVWPQCTMTANSVQIFFTAGYNPDPTYITSVPDTDGTTQAGDYVGSPPEQQTSYTFASGLTRPLYLAILMLVSHWYLNREPVVAGAAMQVPHGIQAIIDLNKVYDFTLGLSNSI